MTGNRTRFLIVSLVVCTLLGAGTLITAAARDIEPEPDSLFKYLSVFTEVLGLVQQAYVEETDVDTLMAGAFEGTADALDPFSVYVPASQVQQYLEHPIGSTPDSGIVLIKERGWMYVAGVVSGSEAQRIGLQRGDLLSRIDGETTRERAVWAVQQRLDQAAQRPALLEVIRRGETLELELQGSDQTPTVAVERQEIRGVSVLRIGRFDGDSAAAMEAVLQELGGEAVESLLLDLRSVAGGEAEAAIAVADLFVDGELAKVIRKGAVEGSFASAREPLWEGRLAVLVDRGTLGAAELLAAVLQQSTEADLIGERTFGWVGRTTAVEISSGGLLVVTDAFYASASGEPIDTGLQPEVRVTERSRRLSESELTLDELILERGVDHVLGEGDVELAA